MWAAAALGAIEAGVGLYYAIKGRDNLPEGINVSYSNMFQKSQQALDREVATQAITDATNRQNISNTRLTQQAFANEMYRDPQSRFAAAVGLGNSAQSEQLKADVASAESRNKLLGTQLSIDEGKANMYSMVQKMRLDKYNMELEQYNREQEAWGSAIQAGISNIGEALNYNSSMKEDSNTATEGKLTDLYFTKSGMSEEDIKDFWKYMKRGKYDEASILLGKY